ncbi:MAG: zinc finger domain-containing protein, partial [Dongiaceae bacterium]
VEPLSPEFTPRLLHGLTRGRVSPLKLFLMDQRRVAGLGNIYVTEALWRARLNPWKRAQRLSRREATRLHRAIGAVLREAVASARQEYRRPGGVSPEEEFQCRVYGCEGRPCARCRRPIKRLAQSARSTYFCPGCQR